MKYANPMAISIFSVIPYLLVAWGYKELTNGDTKTFWIALGVLLGSRLFFFIIERLGDILSWRLYRRKIVVDNALTFLKANGFPPRKDPDDDFLGYLGSIQRDPECAASLRKSAFDLEKILAAIEQIGILVGARTWDAWDAALNIYAPKSHATHRL